MEQPVTRQNSNRFQINKLFLIFFAYFGLFFLGKFLKYGLEYWQSYINLAHVLMLLGGLLGLAIGFADRLVYAYIANPEDEYSHTIRTLVAQKNFRQLYSYLSSTSVETKKLATNNVIFLAVWVVLAFFLITTSFNGFGKGVILGVGLSLAYGLFSDINNLPLLKQRLFWPIARKLSDDETKISIYLFFGAFVLLTLLAI